MPIIISDDNLTERWVHLMKTGGYTSVEFFTEKLLNFEEDWQKRQLNPDAIAEETTIWKEESLALDNVNSRAGSSIKTSNEAETSPKPMKKKKSKKKLKEYRTVESGNQVYKVNKSGRYVCDICDKDFLNLYILHTHRKVHTNPQVCWVCGKKFVTKSMIQRHYLSHLKKSYNKALNIRAAFEVKDGILMMVKTNQSGVREENNAIELPNELGLAENSTTSGEREGEGPCEDDSLVNKCKVTDNWRYKCDLCDKDFLTFHIMKMHRKIHTDPHACKTCDKIFRSKSMLERHSLSHGKKFDRPRDAQRKPRLRAKKPAPSTVGQEFLVDVNDPNSVSRNKRQPSIIPDETGMLLNCVKDPITGDLRYKCDFCNKDFRTRGIMKVHRNVHTNPRVCMYCAKSFSSNSKLQRHISLHANGRYKPPQGEGSDQSFSLNHEAFAFDIQGPTHQNEAAEHSETLHRPVSSQNGAVADQMGDDDSDEGPKKRLPPNWRYKCDHCDKDFRTYHILKMHRKIHLDPKVCVYCNKVFNSNSKLQRHISLHVAGPNGGLRPADSLQNQLIDDPFDTELQPEPEENETESDKPKKPKMSVDARTLYYEKLEIEGAVIFKCLVCTKESSNLGEQLQHFTSCHSDLITRTQTGHLPATNKTYSCTKCPFTCRKHSELISHKNREHKQPVPCDICGRMLRDKYSLQGHKQVVHTDTMTHFCEHCGRGFKSKCAYRYHVRARHMKLNLICDICGKSCAHERLLSAHRLTHSVIAAYACPYQNCGRRFKTKSCLTEHISRLHTGTSKRSCRICHKVFSCSSGLAKHYRSLHGGKVYSRLY